MKNFKRVLLTLVAALLVFAMCFAMVGCGKDSDKDKDDKSGSSSKVEVKKDKPEDIADKAMKAMWIDYDADAFVKLINEDVVSAMCEENEMTEDEFVEQMQAYLDQIGDAIKASEDAGAKMTVDYKVGEVNDADAEDLEDTKDEYKEKGDIDITDLKFVDAEVVMSAEIAGEEQSESQDMTVSVVEIDGQWYLDPTNMDMGA